MKNILRKSSSKIISLVIEKVAASAASLNSLFTILLSSVVSVSILLSLLFLTGKSYY